MYGAGKLLLKDTVLEMKANRRYGVVGHNGRGGPVAFTGKIREEQGEGQTNYKERSGRLE